MQTSQSRRKQNRRGAAMVEFAIALPLMILLLLGCIDFGRFAYDYISVSSAANEGAAFASLNPPGKFGGDAGWIAAVRQRVMTESGTLQPPLAAENISVQALESELVVNGISTGMVSVQVSHTFNMLVNWPALPDTLVMGRRVTLSQTP